MTPQNLPPLLFFHKGRGLEKGCGCCPVTERSGNPGLGTGIDAEVHLHAMGTEAHCLAPALSASGLGITLEVRVLRSHRMLGKHYSPLVLK